MQAGHDVEVEAKLGVERPEEILALLGAPDPARLAGFVADGPLGVVDAVDRYLDTEPDGGLLRAAGLRARLRITAGGVVLAVKSRATVTPDGVATRMELEAPATADLDPTAWPPSPARACIVETVGDRRLVEIAALRQHRQVRSVRRGDALVELSLDALTALGADGAELATRLELEAELKAGPATALEELVRALAAIEGVAPPLGSKLEFALAARAER